MYNVVYCIILTPRPAPAPRPPPPAGRVGRVTAHASGGGAARRCVLASSLRSPPALLAGGCVGPRTADRVRGSGETALPQRAPRAGPAPGSYPPRVPATPVCATVEPGPRGGAPGVSRDPRPREPR